MVKWLALNYSPTNERASRWLDMLRGLSALVVVISHVQELFFVHSASAHSLYIYTDIGHQAVMVFFVLSGYLISGTIFRGIVQEKFSWSDYLISRFTRLYVVLIPALAMGFLIDHLGMRVFHGTGVYYTFASSSTLRVLFFNLLFLQQIHVPTFGSNGPLWSLSFEFWYYIIFPLGFMAIISRSTPKKALYGIATVALCFLEPRSIMSYFIVWLFGAVLHFVPRTWLKVKKFKIVLTATSIISITLTIFIHPLISGGSEFNTPADYLIGVAVAIGIYTILGIDDNARKQKSIVKELASFSYTLYLVHYPLLFFIHAWFIQRGWQFWHVSPATLAFGFLLVILSLFYAWIISLFTEKKTSLIRKLLKSRYSAIVARHPFAQKTA